MARLTRAEKARAARRAIENHISEMIDVLDQIDGDTDLEPDVDDEPWLGSAPYPPGKYALDAEHDPAEAEPSLGSLDRAINQDRWAEGSGWNSYNEFELDPSEKEYSLGSPIGNDNQEHWAQGLSSDLEANEAALAVHS